MRTLLSRAALIRSARFALFAIPVLILGVSGLASPRLFSALLPIIGVPLILLVLALWGLRRESTRGFLTGLLRPATPVREERWRWAGAAIGVVFLAGCFAVLERMQPSYFTQDDNFAQFLPVVLDGCRSAAAGAFPEWNLHQFLGLPTAALGVYSLTYPVTYLSCWVAGGPLGNPYLVLEVFAAIHLLAGFLISWWLMRLLGVGPFLAMAAALSFVLCGYTLVAGRSWYYMLPVVVWTPLLGVCVVRLLTREVGWKWAIATGLAIGGFFHAGNAQMWVYTLLLYGVTVVSFWLLRGVPGRRLLWTTPALLVGIAVSAPLLIPQMWVTRDIVRFGGTGRGIIEGFGGLFMPTPLVHVPDPHHFGSMNYEQMGQMYYSGTVFFVAGFAGLMLLAAALLHTPGNARSWLRDNIWLVAAALSFDLALGWFGGLWVVMARLPVFSEFNLPLKFLPFLVLFTVMAGAIVLERFTAARRRRFAWTAGLSVSALVLILFHVVQARASFYSWGTTTYPELPAEMAALQSAKPASARVFALAPERSIDPTFPFSMKHNLASIYGVYSFDGYDPLAVAMPSWRALTGVLNANPAGALCAYGTRWIIIHRSGLRPVFSPNPNTDVWQVERLSLYQQTLRRALQQSAQLRADGRDLQLWELPCAQTTIATAAGQDLPAEAGVQSLQVHLPPGSPEQLVTIKLLQRPGIQVSAATGRKLPVMRDGWGRVVVRAPAEAGVLTVSFRSPWTAGIIAGLACALLALAVMAWIARRETRRGVVTLQESRRTMNDSELITPGSEAAMVDR